MKLRIVFMGSPEFAVPALRQLHMHFDVVGVITQPDKPAGRGKQITASPVKVLAESLNIEVLQPVKLRDPDVFEVISGLKPDLIVVAAYGQILRSNILEIPRFGCINIHPSLLPRWRGASPIPAALLAGDTVTGVTIMKMDAGMDSGPILRQVEEKIHPQDNAETLSNRLAQIGADLLIATIQDYVAGKIIPISQDEDKVTFSRLITKEDGLLDLNKPIKFLINQVKAYTPWPGARIIWKENPLRIIQASGLTSAIENIGERGIKHGFPAIAVHDGWLILEEVQPAGKRPMNGKDFLRGTRDWA